MPYFIFEAKTRGVNEKVTGLIEANSSAKAAEYIDAFYTGTLAEVTLRRLNFEGNYGILELPAQLLHRIFECVNGDEKKEGRS